MATKKRKKITKARAKELFLAACVRFHTHGKKTAEGRRKHSRAVSRAIGRLTIREMESINATAKKLAGLNR